MKVVLDIAVQNRMNSYLDTAYKSSIVFAINGYEHWYLDKHIQLITYRCVEHGIKLIYKGANYQKELYKEILSVRHCTSHMIRDDIIEFLRAKISEGYYVEMGMDEFYLHDKVNYQRRHYFHPSLFYGFDNDKQELFALGFNATNSFTALSFSYNEVKSAFDSFIHASPVCPSDVGAYLYKRVENLSFAYEQLVPRFLYEFEEYLFSIRSDACISPYVDPAYERAFSFGLNTYDTILMALRDPEFLRVDYRSFHIIAEHKTEISFKLKWLCSQLPCLREPMCGVLASYDDLIAQAERLRIKALYSFNKKCNSETLIPQLQRVQQLDSELSQKIYETLLPFEHTI